MNFIKESSYMLCCPLKDKILFRTFQAMSDCKFFYQEIIRDLPKQLKIVDLSAVGSTQTHALSM